MKKNNKGFSLVELIVVVLIMGIIAVALAPQVIKWVENSRKAADASAYDELVEELQVALVNKEAYDSAKTKGYEFHIYADGVYVKDSIAATYAKDTVTKVTADGTGSTINASDTSASADPLYMAIYKVDPAWFKFSAKSSDVKSHDKGGADVLDDHYVIKVTSTDVTVDRTETPDPETNY